MTYWKRWASPKNPRVLVLNKLDLVTDDPDTFDSRIPAQDGQAVTRVALTSALEGWGISELRRAIDEELSPAMDSLPAAAAL